MKAVTKKRQKCLDLTLEITNIWDVTSMGIISNVLSETCYPGLLQILGGWILHVSIVGSGT